ncbi:hypothetical protein [Streptomyces albireticuli]|nr:hypothetical protein [Streptomyces albireticuli]
MNSAPTRVLIADDQEMGSRPRRRAAPRRPARKPAATTTSVAVT